MHKLYREIAPRAHGNKAADRPFMVWDGEGVTHPGDREQSYVLFGCTGYGVPDYITGRDLRTAEILAYLYDTATYYDKHIHVMFGFSYDVDQWLKDIPAPLLRLLKKKNHIAWNGYSIDYIPRKMFKLKRWGKGQKRVTIYDGISFFATNLISACKTYLSPSHPLLAQVDSGKAKRGQFRYSQLESIILPYWEVENQLCLELYGALRQSMLDADIRLKAWFGPGAVANELIKAHGLANHLKESRAQMPDEVTNATAFAFFGGRFEGFMVGRIEGPIYSYDIRSAYPAALSIMPGLIGGKWRQELGEPEKLNPWALYNYILREPRKLSARAMFSPGPIPVRNKMGIVSFGLSGSGWVYGHEIIMARAAGWPVEIIESWQYDGDGTKPFEFVGEMYELRAQLKREGKGAQYAYKVGMNSVYGKLCQVIGWNEAKGISDKERPPRYHSQWYAGQITSWCRSMLYGAMMQAPNDIISVETDGIYSRVPLKLHLGERLGQWEEEIYDEMIFVQSGFYMLRKGTSCKDCGTKHKDCGGWMKFRVRGLSKGEAPAFAVRKCLRDFAPIRTTVNRYGAFTGALGTDRLHAWYNEPMVIGWGGNGKRIHEKKLCPGCRDNRQVHRTIQTYPFPGPSHPRSLPWADNDTYGDLWRNIDAGLDDGVA